MATSDAEQTCEDSLSKKKQKVEERAGDDQDEDCTICWRRVRERPFTTLVCNHIFHLDCIGSEFNIMGCMQCPTCRQVDPVGNWRFWDNELPANVLLRRVKRSSALLQPGSSSSGDLANVSPQGLRFHNSGELGHNLARRSEDFRNWYRSQATQQWLFSTDGVRRYTSDSEISGLQNPGDVSQLAASDSQRQGRVVRDVSPLGGAAVQDLHPARTTSLYDNSLEWIDVNHTTRRRQAGSRMNQRQAYDMDSRQVQGQHAANLHAATGPALHGTVRRETQGVNMAAESQRRTHERRTREVTYEPELSLQARVRLEAIASRMRYEASASRMGHRESAVPRSVDAEGRESAARVNHGMHDSERIGHEVQAKNMQEGGFEEEPPALQARVWHGRQQTSASQSRARER